MAGVWLSARTISRSEGGHLLSAAWIACHPSTVELSTNLHEVASASAKIRLAKILESIDYIIVNFVIVRVLV